jgi:cysteine desulfurase
MPYFDHNATTPLADCAREAWLRIQAENWHNPSSPTRAGARARIRLESYLEAVAVLLGGDPAQYVFNSGATEGARAVLAHWAKQLPPRARIAISATEHACVLEAAGHYFPKRIDWLPHESGGLLTPASIQTAIAAGAAGIVVMAANNESGVLQPWSEIATVCKCAAVPYLCDATQWLGKLPGAGLGSTNAWIIASGHKFGAPKGIGLIKLPGSEPDLHKSSGGLQQNGHRAGTVDLAGIAAFTAALAQAEQKDVIWESQRASWRDNFENSLINSLQGTRIIAKDRERLWNTSLIIVPRGNQIQWVSKFDKLDAQIATGSACTTAQMGPSHVLAALGLPAEYAQRALRISSGWQTSEQDWHTLLEIFHKTNLIIN